MARLASAIGSLTLLSILTACSSDIPLVGNQALARPGLVVGDEPFAVNAGAKILQQGGDAADAAAAVYFALSVTYPVAAGLGGGGICVVHDPALDPARGRDEAYNFMARDPSSGGEFAIPGNVRGFALIQQVHGRLPWQRVIAPAEGLAGAGFPIARALDDRLAQSVNVIRLDAGLSAEFLDESGQVKPAGSIVSNAQLAATLGAVRERGSNGFYAGDVGQKISAYSTAQGGAIELDELQRSVVKRTASHDLSIGSAQVHLPAMQTGAGEYVALLMGSLSDQNGNPAGDSRSAAESATRNVLQQFGVSDVPRDLGSTGFAVMDSDGQVVSCAVTMNGPFGSGRTVDTTGITLAKAPSKKPVGIASAFLAPVIVTSGNDVSLAGAGAGGPNGTSVLAEAVMRLARGEDVTRSTDLDAARIAPYDSVDAIACQNGTCAVLPDPGAHGLGAAVSP